MKMKSTNILNAGLMKARRFFFCVFTSVIVSLFLPAAAFAEESDGNQITESSLFKGLLKMLNDFSVALMIIVPIVCMILIVVFSLLAGSNCEAQDKEKWQKNRKTVIVAMAWAFGASSLVTLITFYLK